eukprot:TRINITY_DN7235_c0_g1_i1.p1 TRINITY_DN7235_c0_g1~~TRINITY_DN7235_c0_g1_i1.p1  ORF type:complete len:341 (-),score=26.57 TRINITY_DN7235_c0_g1_i1:23-1024(-)
MVCAYESSASLLLALHPSPELVERKEAEATARAASVRQVGCFSFSEGMIEFVCDESQDVIWTFRCDGAKLDAYTNSRKIKSLSMPKIQYDKGYYSISCASARDGLLHVGTKQGDVVVWDSAKGLNPVQVMMLVPNEVGRVVGRPPGRGCVVGQQNRLSILNGQNEEHKRSLAEAVTQLAVAEEGGVIWVGMISGGLCYVPTAGKGDLVECKDGHTDYVSGLVCSRDGARAWSCGLSDGKIMEWKVGSAGPVRCIVSGRCWGAELALWRDGTVWSTCGGPLIDLKAWRNGICVNSIPGPKEKYPAYLLVSKNRVWMGYSDPETSRLYAYEAVLP